MMTRLRAGPDPDRQAAPELEVRTPVFGRKLAPSRTTNSRCWVRTSEDPTAAATSSTDSAGSRTASIASRAACGRAFQASPGGVLDIGSRLQVWRALQPGPSVRARASFVAEAFETSGRARSPSIRRVEAREHPVGRPIGGLAGERVAGIERAPAPAAGREARDVERAPVDRDGDVGTDEPGGIDRRRWAEPGRSARRSPPPDRQERDIDVPGQPRHPLVEGRVAGEVDARRALDQESERSRVTVARPSRMASRDRGHANARRARRGRWWRPRGPRDRGGTRSRPGHGARRSAARPGIARRDAPWKWSGWLCEIRTASIAPKPAGSGVGPSRRRGPSRAPRTGSVRMRTPSSSIRTVAWPMYVSRRALPTARLSRDVRCGAPAARASRAACVRSGLAARGSA